MPDIPLKVRTGARTRIGSWRSSLEARPCLGRCPLGVPGPPSSSSGLCPGRANCSISPPSRPFLMPIWITFSPVLSQAFPEVWLPLLSVPGNPGALAVWQPRPSRSHGRQFSNSGCLGRGRPVYPGQGPGRGCSFLPMPLDRPATQHTDSALPTCICSFCKYLRGAYCVPGTVLHAEDIAGKMTAKFPAAMELTL